MRAPFFTLALRELRGGFKGFRVFLGCLILGVAAIAGVGSLSRSIVSGLEAEGAALLAGDLEVRLFRKDIDDEQRAFLEMIGDVAEVTRLRSNARAIDAEKASVIELKAVDDAYPFYGGLELSVADDRSRLFGYRDGQWGAVADRALAERLGVDIGGTIRAGIVDFQVRGYLENEPDRANQGWQLGPTLMTSHAALAATDLLREGSVVNHYYKIKLPDGVSIKQARDRIDDAYEDEDWRLRDRSRSAPGVRNFVERFGTFLTLVGLTALVVGGVGVSNAVRTYLDVKTDTIATLKILGADGRTVFLIYMTQVMLLAVVAVVIGLILGASVPWLLQGAGISDKLPVPPKIGFYPAPLITAAVYGLLIALAFSVWPLGKARDVPAARLFRAVIAPDRRWPRRGYVLLTVAALLLVVLFAVGLSDIRDLAAGFVAASAVSLLLLRLTGTGIQAIARRLPRVRRPGLRMAIANLHRPGATTGAVVMSLGLGLTLFATLALVEGNLNRQISDQIPQAAPSFYFVDVQPYEIDDFLAAFDEVGGVGEVRSLPFIRGRLASLAGTDVEDAEVGPEARWMTRGDIFISFAEQLPEGAEVTDGTWWPAEYQGPPKISIWQEQGRALGLSIGDQVELTLLGRPITAEVASFRTNANLTFGGDFVILFDPATLKAAPHPYIVTAEADSTVAEGELQYIITERFPAVTTIPLSDTFNQLRDLLGELSTAIRATAAITIASGILVLAGAMAAGHKRRVYDSVVLKVLGARRGDVLKAFLIEYLLLGGLTAVIALVLGLLAGYAVIVPVMQLDFTPLPWAMLATILGSLIVTVGIGLVGSWAALRVRPAILLRTA